MRVVKQIWGLAGAAWLSAACGGDPDAEAVGRSLAEGLDLPRWRFSDQPVLSIGVVEGDQELQFFRVKNAVRLVDETIIVGNAGTGQLRYFDRDGQFLMQTGGRGGGPGEFRWLGRVYRLGADSVMAFDRAGRKSYYDRKGDFLGSENVFLPGLWDTFPMDIWLYRLSWVDGVPHGPGRVDVARALDRLPPPPVVPGYHYVRVDQPGNIWVADDIQPGGKRRHWTVFVIDLPPAVSDFDLPSLRAFVPVFDHVLAQR